MLAIRRVGIRLPSQTSNLLRVSVSKVNNRSGSNFTRPTKPDLPKSTDMSSIFSPKAMPPVGPYSQAIKTEHAIYCSGQLPADVEGNLVEGSIGEKTAACLRALEAVLDEAISGLHRIVKVQILLTDMKDFAEMNAEYEKWIKHKPARSCVAVKVLPKGADLEIECIALPGTGLQNLIKYRARTDRKDPKISFYKSSGGVGETGSSNQP